MKPLNTTRSFLKRSSVLLFLIVLQTPTTHAAISQELNRTNFRSSVCNIEKMDVSFRIDESFGEPLITSRMRWTAGPNTSTDCLSRNTNIWVAARTPSDELKYVKLSPGIPLSGADYGSAGTESPSWSVLFCDAPSDSASCETQTTAQQMINLVLRPESFEVVTKAQAITNLNTPPQERSAGKAEERANIGFDDLLADAIDSSLAPQDRPNATPAPIEQPVINEPSIEDLEAQRLRQKAQQVKSAVTNVVTLLASSLAQYKAPAHSCETERQVNQWVQARSDCELSLRQESNHQYLCSEDGRPKEIRTASTADLNLARDISKVSDIRVSPNGWVSLVLELKSDLNKQTNGSFKTDSWQFTTTEQQLEALQQLAGSIVVLRQHCESDSSS